MRRNPRSPSAPLMLAAVLLVASCDDEAGADPSGGANGGLNGGLSGGTAGATAGAAATSAGTSAGTTAGSAGTTATAGTSGGPDAGVDDAGSDGSVDAAAADGGSDAGAGGSDAALDPEDPYAEVRQVCVDEINMYRATLGLDPLQRASRAQEACSDDGAKQDGDNDAPHSSAGDCAGLGAQNTCPGWPVGGSWGPATLAEALKQCLRQMWDEGEPPGGREACIQAYFDGDTACFLAHGHYLNMSAADTERVACGFYRMANGDYWMNQDFGG